MGRGVPVSNAQDELRRALDELGVKMASLPDDVLSTCAVSDGFSLIVGFGPKNLNLKDGYRKLVSEALVFHPQMVTTMQTNLIYVVYAGRPVTDLCPVRLPEIEPHEFAPHPRIIPIPDRLQDPVSETTCEINPPGAPKGKLVLRVSAVSMRWQKKGRHHIRYVSHNRVVGFLEVLDIANSTWVDRMYGECLLDRLSEFEKNERNELADAPVTRALDNWIREEVIRYENEFKKRQNVEASQEQRNKLQELNKLLDKWKNKFLDDSDFQAGAVPGEGKGRTKRRPLPAVMPVSVSVRCAYRKAGIGVWLQISPEFLDPSGNRVAAPAYEWHSSDWAVATVDPKEGVVTHTPGNVELWVETTDGRLRSPPVQIEVVDAVATRVDPPSIEVGAGKIEQLAVTVTDRAGKEHNDVFMTWMQDDSSIVSITASGKVIGRKPGATTVYAMDEQCLQSPGACHITVVPAETGPGDAGGKAYPRILLSDIDPDPLNPDGEPYKLFPEDGPVHQPTPQHVQNNIWFINLQCPLAKLYFEEYGSGSTQWRSYHVERYIEALTKIRLNLAYQMEEDLSFDEMERRWREIAAEVQSRALEDLKPLLAGGELSDA
jgi:hypothetical protein